MRSTFALFGRKEITFGSAGECQQYTSFQGEMYHWVSTLMPIIGETFIHEGYALFIFFNWVIKVFFNFI